MVLKTGLQESSKVTLYLLKGLKIPFAIRWEIYLNYLEIRNLFIMLDILHIMILLPQNSDFVIEIKRHSKVFSKHILSLHLIQVLCRISYWN